MCVFVSFRTLYHICNVCVLFLHSFGTSLNDCVLWKLLRTIRKLQCSVCRTHLELCTLSAVPLCVYKCRESNFRFFFCFKSRFLKFVFLLLLVLCRSLNAPIAISPLILIYLIGYRLDSIELY